jgi:hypothetical protein
MPRCWYGDTSRELAIDASVHVPATVVATRRYNLFTYQPGGQAGELYVTIVRTAAGMHTGARKNMKHLARIRARLK